MATSTNGETSPRIVSIQSVMPTKVTPPGQSHRLTISTPLSSSTIQSRLRIILYYHSASYDDSARTVTALIKETMSVTLSEYPGIAGRLRRDREGEGYWEVKYNDAGVRLLEAKAETTVEEVLASKDREGMEEKLCYWKDVDVENPNFSVLFYIQVTDFQGGYSVGISCNLLLADPLFLATFLKKWALDHNLMLAQRGLSKSPIHLQNFLNALQPNMMKLEPSHSNTTANTTTMLFTASRPQAGNDTVAVVARCVEETSKRLEGRIMPEFLLLGGDQFGNTEVKSSTNDRLFKRNNVFEGKIDVAWWDHFGLEEMTLIGDNKPVHVSCRIVSPLEQGIAMTMMGHSGEEGDPELLISVTIPRKI